MPDSDQTRFSRLEMGMARMEQRIEDVSIDIRQMAPLVIEHAKMAVAMDQLRAQQASCAEDTKAVKDSFEQYRREVQEREESRRRERKSDRKWQIGTSLVAAGLVISAIALLVPG